MMETRQSQYVFTRPQTGSRQKGRQRRTEAQKFRFFGTYNASKVHRADVYTSRWIRYRKGKFEKFVKLKEKKTQRKRKL